MNKPIFLPQPLRSNQLLTPPESFSALSSRVSVDDASVAALFPLLSPPNLSDSKSAQSPVDHSIISRQDHAQKRKLDSIEPDSKQERRRCEFAVQEDFICEECRQIDFQKVLDLDADTLQKPSNSRGIFIGKLATRCNQPLENNCALCRVFSAVCAPIDSPQEPQEPQEPQQYQLRAYSFLKYHNYISFFFLPKDLRNKDQPYLAVAPTDSDGDSISFDAKTLGHIFCYTEDSEQPWIFAPQVVPRDLDYSVVRQWLDYCRSHHKKLCRSKDTQLPGLKLIDCNLRSVIPASPSCVYAALSYVWGRSKRDPYNVNAMYTDTAYTLPPSLPNVILDSITVTKALGLQYLWVDKFCIDQKNPDKKHDQISQMDAVYEKAEVTIIAAAGDDEDCGLPGVGTKPRRLQPTAKLGNIRVVSSMVHPHCAIASSKWSTRGWTYQEAVLSRRRLVFTEDQTYFECRAMNCYESVQGKLDVLHTKNKYKYLQFMHSGIFSGKRRTCFGPMDAENLSRLSSLAINLNHIRQYSERNLTFEHDSLQAFAGITRHLERSKFRILQLWGVPFLHPSQSKDLQEDRKSLVVGLLWKHQQDYSFTSGKISRRSEFPSWSWAGWVGGKEFVVENELGYGYFTSQVFIVYLEFQPGCLVEHSYLFRSLAADEPQFRYPRALHLDVWVVSPEKLTFDEPFLPSFGCSLAGFDAELSLSQGPANADDIPEMFGKGKWELIVLGTSVSTTNTKMFLMVVEQHADSSARVGMMTLEGSDLKGLEEHVHMKRRSIRLM